MFGLSWRRQDATEFRGQEYLRLCYNPVYTKLHTAEDREEYPLQGF